MAVLQKAVLVSYSKLNDLIELGTIDNDTVYFLSGKDVYDKIKEVKTALNAKAETSSIPHLTAGEGINISETGVITASATPVDLSGYIKEENLSLDGIDLVADYEAAKAKHGGTATPQPAATEEHH